MHFYYFSTFFCLYFEPQTTQTDAKIIYDSYCCNLIFLRISASSVVNPRRPSRSLNLVPRLAVVDGVLLAILTDCSSRKQKYLDYD